MVPPDAETGRRQPKEPLMIGLPDRHPGAGPYLSSLRFPASRRNDREGLADDQRFLDPGQAHRQRCRSARRSSHPRVVRSGSAPAPDAHDRADVAGHLTNRVFRSDSHEVSVVLQHRDREKRSGAPSSTHGYAIAQRGSRYRDLLTSVRLAYVHRRRGQQLADNAIGAVLDVDQIQLVLQDFSEATGLATVAADARGLPITPACAFTDFCQAMRSDPLRNRMCHGCDAHGGLQSMIEDGPRVYRCHSGLVDFSVPLTDGDTYLGAILCGQVRLTSIEQPDYITQPTQWRGDPVLEELYDEVPVSSLSRVAAAAKMLLGLSTGIEGLKQRRTRRELPIIQRTTAPTPVTSAKPTAAQILHEHLDAEDLAGGYAQLTRLLDELFHSSQDLREALAELEDKIIDVASDCSPRLVPHLSEMVKRQRARRTSSPSRYQTQLYFERILSMILDELRRSRPHRQRDLRDLLNDIARHPNRALSLTEAAAAAHWSPGHLSKVFKSVTGYTFVSYVTLWRLSRAQLMLASTQMPVQQIASELDFQQVNYFSRVFRSYTGISPSEYRRRSVSRDGRPTGVSLPTHHHALLRA